MPVDIIILLRQIASVLSYATDRYLEAIDNDLKHNYIPPEVLKYIPEKQLRDLKNSRKLYAYCKPVDIVESCRFDYWELKLMPKMTPYVLLFGNVPLDECKRIFTESDCVAKYRYPTDNNKYLSDEVVDYIGSMCNRCYSSTSMIDFINSLDIECQEIVYKATKRHRITIDDYKVCYSKLRDRCKAQVDQYERLPYILLENMYRLLCYSSNTDIKDIVDVNIQAIADGISGCIIYLFYCTVILPMDEIAYDDYRYVMKALDDSGNSELISEKQRSMTIPIMAPAKFCKKMDRPTNVRMQIRYDICMGKSFDEICGNNIQKMEFAIETYGLTYKALIRRFAKQLGILWREKTIRKLLAAPDGKWYLRDLKKMQEDIDDISNGCRDVRLLQA